MRVLLAAAIAALTIAAPLPAQPAAPDLSAATPIPGRWSWTPTAAGSEATFLDSAGRAQLWLTLPARGARGDGCPPRQRRCAAADGVDQLANPQPARKLQSGDRTHYRADRRHRPLARCPRLQPRPDRLGRQRNAAAGCARLAGDRTSGGRLPRRLDVVLTRDAFLTRKLCSTFVRRQCRVRDRWRSACMRGSAQNR